MSNKSNDALADRVKEYIENHTGTMLADMLQLAWDSGDLEQCHALMKEADEQEIEYDIRTA